MAYRNGAPYGSFLPPNGNFPMMNHQNRHYGPPRFNNNNNCPWRPPPERPNFNINRFMHPPHMVQGPEFAAGNTFGQETPSGPHENFPFTSQQNIPSQPVNSPQIGWGQQVTNHQNSWGPQVSGHQNPPFQQVKSHQNSWGPQVNGHHNPPGPLVNGHKNSWGPQVNGHQNPPGPLVNGHQNSWGPQVNGHQNSPDHQFSGQNFQNQQFKGQHFQGQPGHSRGAMRGHRGGQGFRGGFHGGFNHNQQPHQTNKSIKKEKVDKRDLPENNLFFCDICDRGFKFEDKFNEHIDGHITCSFKDCPFIAAPKLVQLHMRMQHSNGMAKRVWSMESEDDVKKWREERKRNFPTVDNVSRKKQERAERHARGEVLETREFGKMARGKGRHRRGDRGKNTRRNQDHASKQESEHKTAGSNDDDSPPEETAIKKSTFNDADCGHDERSVQTTGTVTSETMEAKAEAHSAAVEVDAEATTNANGDAPEASLPHTESAMDTSLSLLAAYGDSGDDGEASGEAPDSAVTVDDPSTVNTSITHPKEAVLPNSFASPSCEADHQNNSSPPKIESTNSKLSPHKVPSAGALKSVDNRESSHPNSSCGTQGLEDANNSRKSEHENDNSRAQNERQNTGGKRGPQSRQKGEPLAKKNKKEPGKQRQTYTLLQKLLAPDMRRERNKVLQCVHYIVKNKFFEKGEHVDKAVPTTN